MRNLRFGLLLPCLLLSPADVRADAAMECSIGAESQVHIGTCLVSQQEVVDGALAIALEFAQTAAKEMDTVTGRDDVVPALTAAQAAWEMYRSHHCGYVGATFGGGSGTGIGMTACEIELTRARTSILMKFAR